MKRVLTISLTCALLCIMHGAYGQKQHRTLIIPVEFTDLHFSTPISTIDSLAGALKAYLEPQFSDSTKFVFDVHQVVSAGNSYAYFGANASHRRDAYAYKMASGIYRSLSSRMDFSPYENADGSLNHLIFITAGVAESAGGGPDQMWPQYVELGENEIPSGLRPRLTAFAMAPELGADGKVSGIGLLAHEFGHILGLKDMYDTDGESSGGVHPGLGPTSLMDIGLENDGGHTPPYLNSIEREMLGIGHCTVIDTCGTYSLEPLHPGGQYCKMPSSDGNKYWLLENRRAQGNDAFIGGEGMYIYKIDKSDSPSGFSTYYQRTLKALERWQLNQINCNPQHPCAEIVYSPKDAAAVFSPGRFALTGISTDAGGNISFKVLEPVRIDGISVFQSSAIIAWSVSKDLGSVEDCRIEWFTQGTPVGSAQVQASADGSCCYTIQGLNPRTSYSFTTTVSYADGSVFEVSGSFTTRIYRKDIFRFIYLGETERNSDGSFKAGSAIPLVVYNSVGEEVEWSFNGRQISTGPDGLWTIPDSGTLKAEITNADGSKEIIIKEILVR